MWDDCSLTKGLVLCWSIVVKTYHTYIGNAMCTGLIDSGWTQTVKKLNSKLNEEIPPRGNSRTSSEILYVSHGLLTIIKSRRKYWTIGTLIKGAQLLWEYTTVWSGARSIRSKSNTTNVWLTSFQIGVWIKVSLVQQTILATESLWQEILGHVAGLTSKIFRENNGNTLSWAHVYDCHNLPIG